MSKHFLMHDGKNIAFNIVRKKVKNVNLRIRPDSTVVVSAPKSVPYESIEQLVSKKASWIIKNIEHFDEKRSNKGRFDYITGEIIQYLGSSYPLKVVQVKNREEVILDGDELFLFVKNVNDLSIKEILFNHWYKEQAKVLFHRTLDKMHPLVSAAGIERPSITLRSMKTRWGSCSWKRQKITLNIELVKTPLECIEYVLLHELVHFKHHKHDTKFYDYLADLMPDWKDRKKILKTFSANLSPL